MQLFGQHVCVCVRLGVVNITLVVVSEMAWLEAAGAAGNVSVGITIYTH